MEDTSPILSIVVLTFALALLILVLIVPLGMKIIQRVQLERRCRGRLVLTFDDGPGMTMTPALMELLRLHGARASFFLVGFRVQRAPDMVQLLRDAGHEIGSHTMMHRDAWQTWPWTANDDIDKGLDVIKRWAGSAQLFRPPFGRITPWTSLALRRRGARVCWWTIDAGDTHPTLPDPADIIRQLINTGGGVVLLHSHDRGEERQRYVLTVTEQLLKAARANGLKICSLSELFDQPFSQPALGEGHVRQA